MISAEQREKLSIIAQLIRSSYGDLVFTIFDIGAVPLGDNVEPFHVFPMIFPGSRVVAFELDGSLCDKLNREAKPGIEYFPIALGQNNERRLLFETEHPMCTSLYCPNSELLKRFNALEVAMLKSVSSIHTMSLDEFVQENKLTPDFIKIDIQGAELDVFKGGAETLKSVVGIVSEVEFVPLYLHQPLFGDVSTFLFDRKLIFHKFLGLAGRTLAPLIINNDLNFATQHLWGDAMFIRDVGTIDDMSDVMLLKMGVLAFLYGSPDVSYCCLLKYDNRNGTEMHKQIIKLVG